MSVMLSHIDISPQDDVEVELQKEDERQQNELKAFLNEELDDDDLLLGNNNSLLSSHGGHPNQYTQCEYANQHQQFHEYPRNPHAQTNGCHGYNADQDYGIYGESRHGDGVVFQEQRRHDHVNDGSFESYHHPQYDNNDSTSQLQTLYEARGRKIVKLEKEMDEKVEELSKQNRILNHKLILATGEKDGALTSANQLQELLHQHKTELKTNEKCLNEERERSDRLEQQVGELTEKLEASEETIDSLHHQIQQMNQSDAIARARSQHESILSTLRQKNQAEVLTLKEKLDDLKQALAWKTEDVNRYREMLDSNSTASEMGMLQHRLRTEENNTRTLRDELEQKNKEIKELDEQLRMYNTLMKTDFNQMSSTPFIPPTAKASLRRGVLDFKTPVSKIQSSPAETPSTPEGTVRNELVNALSSNHERRREITALREENTRLQHELSLREKTQLPANITPDEKQTNDPCEKCIEYKNLLSKKEQEHEHEINALRNELNEARESNNELQLNMVEMVKTLDKQKIKDVETQNNAMLKFVDDAKENLRNELTKVHEAEKDVLQTEMEKLTAELFHTKEEYLKLCEEMKAYEKQLQNDARNESKIELEELRNQLEHEFEEKLSAKESELTAKYLDDIARERDQWVREAASEKKREIEQRLALEKVSWAEEYEKIKEKEIELAVRSAKLDWDEKHVMHDQEEQAKFKKLKVTLKEEQYAIVEEKLKTARLEWITNHEVELQEKIHAVKEKVQIEEKKNCEKLIADKIRTMEEQYINKISVMEEIVSSQKQDLHKAQVTLQLKESTFLRKETDFRHSIKLLQSEIHELNERLVSKDRNQSQSSIIFNEIVETEIEDIHQLKGKLRDFETKEKTWLTREKELSSLLRKTGEKLKYYKLSQDCDSLFKDVSLDEIDDSSFNILNNSEKKRQKSNDEERLSNALELSRQKITSLISSNEELEKQVAMLERELESKVKDHESTVRNLENKFEEYKKKMFADNEKEKAMLNEKHLMEMEKVKLIEENKRVEMKNGFRIEKETLRNNLLIEISGQLGPDEVTVLKEKHVKEIRKLKQNFCEKLERIGEMKKKWMVEEERKRLESLEGLTKEYDINLTKLTQQNEEELSRQQKHWEAMTAKLEEEQSSAMLKLVDQHQLQIKKLQEKFELNVMVMTKEKDNLSKELAHKQQELDMITGKHEQLLVKLKTLEEASIFGDSQSNLPVSSSQTNPMPSLTEQIRIPNLNSKSIEELRLFYLQSIKNIQEDVTSYTRAMKQKCNNEIREAVRRERKELVQKINQRKEDRHESGTRKPSTRRENIDSRHTTPPVKEKSNKPFQASRTTMS